MKKKRRYFFLDDFEHRLLVGCLMTARNEYGTADTELTEEQQAENDENVLSDLSAFF